jgi:hypothetical protein
MISHLLRIFVSPIVFTFFISFVTLLQAQDAPPQEENAPQMPAKQTNPAAKNRTPVVKMEGYDVTTSPANIAPTAAVRKETVEVSGQPRMTKGHPNTYWDEEDIHHYKEMLKTSKELQILFAAMKDAMDKRIAEPIIPPPQKGTDGKWMFPGDYFPPISEAHAKDTPAIRFRSNFGRDGADVSDLGTMYALTGDAKYAEYARKLLLAYANCSKWGPSPVYKLRSGEGYSGFLFVEGLIMMHWARGYDLIYNLPSWTKEDRAQLHDDFFRPLAMSGLYPIALDRPEEPWYACARNNRGLFNCVSILMAGYVTEDQELVNAALYGIHPTITKSDNAQAAQFPAPKVWEAATAENPSYGLMTRYFSPDCIRGGMWIEPSAGYGFYVLGSMVGAAEILWHHNIDLYRHNDAIFKNMFDFPILSGYPDLSEPGLGGSHRDFLINFDVSNLYEYAYRRYRDPRYLAFINNPNEVGFLSAYDTEKYKYMRGLRNLKLAGVGGGPPSVLFDLPATDITTLIPPPSVNYSVVGYSVLRTAATDGKGLPQNLTLVSGPTASKAMPDKLHVDLFAFNDVLMPSAGVVFPYDQPILPKWYQTTLAHNTLTVDEKSQDYYGADARSTAHADQVIFAPGSTVGMQRAWSNSVYPGVTMDRAVFMTSDYFADIFGVFSKSPHKFDLAWHIRGGVSSDLKFDPMTFPEPAANGYITLTNVRHASVPDQPWSMVFTRDSHVARLEAAKAPAAQVIVADGGLFYDKILQASTRTKPTAPTILERREMASTVYGNALDYSDSKDGYVKGVEQEGGLDAGYGLLKVQTAKGGDLCFAAYRPATYKAGGLETDSQQAFVEMDGSKVRAMYLGGGKTLKAGGGAIERSEPGLAYVERLQGGDYIVGNPSTSDATITVTIPALAGLKAFHVNAKGERGEVAGAVKADGSFSVALRANAKVELSNP